MNRQRKKKCACGNENGFSYKGGVSCENCLYPGRGEYKEWQIGDPLPDLDFDEKEEVIHYFRLSSSQTGCALGNIEGCDNTNIEDRNAFQDKVNEKVREKGLGRGDVYKTDFRRKQ